ncbi:MAG: biopolymer transporter ExbD [Deltaproteobacteria bacterium]|nr:biopolymer transporter ExbD [Deltaproteobacteria bacterium]MBN2671146.1 biopolymer transporter ExbD [Deltaproteobacteria bacterium]
MKFTSDKKNRAIATLEVTPLVDVVFLLLIFFLLTATYVKNPNIDIDLPKASSQEMFPKDKDITVAIKKDGTMKVENEVVTLKKLETYLKKRLSKSGKAAVVIVKADKGAKHGNVVSVMDMAKRVGYSKLAIAVDAPAGGDTE